MRLEINGKEADYNGKIAITRQTLDINNLNIRLIDITNRIVLPPTDNNKKIIVGANRLESGALDSVFNGKVIDSFFLFNGSGVVTEVGESWKIQLADNSKLFFDDLNKKINELDLEADDFVYNSTNYTALKNATASAWIWPIVQMHETASATSLQYLRPHFNYWVLINKIFTSRDKILDVNSDFLQNIAIQANSTDFLFTSYQKILTGNQIGDINDNDFQHNVSTTTVTIDVGTDKTIFRIRGYIAAQAGAVIKFNDDEIALNFGVNYYDEETSPITGEITISSVGVEDFDNTLLYTIIKESSFDDLAAFDPIGYKIKTYDNLPDLSQLDLFKDALILTNSIIVPDSLQNKISLLTLAGLSTQKKLNWSDKLIDKSENIKSSVKKLSKTNRLTYKNGVGNSFFNASSEFLPDENEFLELRYSGSPDKADYAVYNVYEVDSDGNNRRVNSNALRVVSIGGDYGKFDPLSWSNISAAFYAGLFESLDSPREITANFNLKKLDVVGFDPMTLIYLEKYNSNFIVESINKYVTGEETSVKLLKYGR